MSKHKNTYPYEWYVYKDDSDVCPDCGNKPRDYIVQPSHPAVYRPVIFVCANGHEWEGRSVEDEIDRITPDDMLKTYQEEKRNKYQVCPRCNENLFYNDGVQQDTDGQYSHYWRCENCKYWETL